nr:hypothetical protein [Tanacetum cinerariifolium]
MKLKHRALSQYMGNGMRADVEASPLSSNSLNLKSTTLFNSFNLYQQHLVRNVDSSSKFYMYPRFLQLMISAQVGDLSSHTTKYTSHALTQKQAADDIVADDIVTDDVATNDVADVVADVVAEVAPTPSPYQSVIVPPSSPPPQQQPSQPSHDAAILIDLLNTLLETCTTLNRKVEALEQDKISQALEITKLKQRVKRLEKKNKLKVSGLRRLKKGRQEESQAHVYHIDLEHVDKVLSMQDEEPEPAELTEVIEVVISAKLMTEVVTTAATIITAFPNVVAPSAARRRNGVVIRDLKETGTPSTIVHFEPKSKDKGKGILVEEPKPLKKQAQIEQDEAYAREKPQTEAQARKNMMVYLKNMARFKMDFFKEEEASKALKRKSESLEQQAAKKQKFDEEVEELKKHLKIVLNDEDDVYTEATPLALKTYCSWYKLKLLDNAADSRLRLLEESATADDKMKK